MVNLGLGTDDSTTRGEVEEWLAEKYSCPKFRRRLRHLSRREELITRMALRDDVRDPGASREWEASIAELQADMVETADDWRSCFPAVERAKRAIALDSGET
jgi:hypothetical protein